MRRVFISLGFVFIVVVVLAHSPNVKVGRFVIQGTTFEQRAPTTFSDAYPEWNPGDSVCPLHPTNAIALAVTAATNSLPVTTLPPGLIPKLSLLSDSGGWFYRVELSLLASHGTVRGNKVPVLVGLDGTVPPIRKVSNEELAAEREKVRENLRKYQMEVIRAGMTPLPVRLTQEMDDQLVAEGVLPPTDAGADKTQRRFGNGFRRQAAYSPAAQSSPGKRTPEEEAKLREEKREQLRQYQMEVIRAGMPPLPLPFSREVEDRLVGEGALPVVPSNTSLTDDEKRARKLAGWRYIQSNAEFHDQLVADGLIPPESTSPKRPRRFGGGVRRSVPEQQEEPRELTPAQKEQKHKEVQRALQNHQMKLIREDKPLLPANTAPLTMEQKKQLEDDGIVFLADGSISNSVTGFCHPPRPGVLAE